MWNSLDNHFIEMLDSISFSNGKMDKLKIKQRLDVTKQSKGGEFAGQERRLWRNPTKQTAIGIGVQQTDCNKL